MIVTYTVFSTKKIWPIITDLKREGSGFELTSQTPMGVATFAQIDKTQWLLPPP